MPPEPGPDFGQRLPLIQQKIAAAARLAGRKPYDVRLMAVSKTQPATALSDALQAGQRLFGENRVQEAAAKWPALQATYQDIELHLIGPLQSNKAEAAVALFDVIETLDRLSLAQALAKAIARQKRAPKILIEVNIGGEPQKAGIAPADLPGFLARCRDEFGLQIAGLMCIPPAADDPLPHFKAMQILARDNHLAELSMGMSGDFEAAIAAGATIVRVGTALFGARDAGS